MVDQSFDLSVPSGVAFRRTRALRILFPLLTFAFAVFALLFLYDALTSVRNQADWILLSITEMVCAAMLVLFAFALRKTRRPPVGLALNESGVNLRWLSGRTDTIPWSRTVRGFALLDYSGNSTLKAYIPELYWELRRWHSVPVALTRDAYDAILVGARAAGLTPHNREVLHSYLGWAACKETRLSGSVNSGARATT